MKRITAEVAFASFLLAVAVLLLVLTLGLGASARLVPLIVVVPLTALLMYRLAREVARGGAVPNEGMPVAETAASVRAELAMMAWLLALPILTSLCGFVVGSALFVLAWLLWRARERPHVALTAALITGVAVWLIFERALRVNLPA